VIKIKGMSINSTLYLSCQGILMLFPLSLKQRNLVTKQEEIVVSKIRVEVERGRKVENGVGLPGSIDSAPKMR
jgi:hypothetical protein